MIYTKFKKDWFIIDESNYKIEKEKNKVHLIKLGFSHPTEEKVKMVLKNFPNTNRYIISNNIKFYNYILKNNKKYYVENEKNNNLISFLRKNNKILLNFENLNRIDEKFILENLKDLLDNTEAILIGNKEKISFEMEKILKSWDGNILIW